MDDIKPAILLDDQGPIRYDWQGIKLLYVAGASVTDIARSLTADCPEYFVRVQNTVSVKVKRDEWQSIKDRALSLAETRKSNSLAHKDQGPRALSEGVMLSAANILASRKTAYRERTSKFIDRASIELEKRPIESLEDASLAGKLFDPIHELARDIHGLHAKEGSHSLQVNVLSNWAGKIPEPIEVETESQE